jgi:acetyl esterase
MPGVWLDDPLCRYLAAEASVVVVNVDYVVAPQHRFRAHRSETAFTMRGL